MNLTCTLTVIVSIIIILQVSICFGYEDNYWVSTLLGSAGRGSKDGDRLTGQVNRPVGVQYYNNSVYITNSEDACIRVFDWQNNYIRTYAGNCYGTGSLDGSLKTGRFLKIRYLTFDGNGTMYVADYCGIRILKDQAMNTFCGSVSTVGYQNGPCPSALFGEVMQIVFFKDEKGGGATNFLISSHPVIRMIDSQGNVTTFAGNGNPSYQNGPLLSASF